MRCPSERSRDVSRRAAAPLVAACLLALAAPSAPARAQGAAQALPRVWVDADYGGGLALSLSLPARPADPEALRAAFDAGEAEGAVPSAWRTHGNRWQLGRTLPRRTERHGLVAGVELDLSTLMSALQAEGYGELDLAVLHPRAAFCEVYLSRSAPYEQSPTRVKLRAPLDEAPQGRLGIRFGYRGGDLARALFPLGVVLLAPLFAIAWLAARVLRAPPPAPTETWYVFSERRRWLLRATWLAWMVSLHYGGLSLAEFVAAPRDWMGFGIVAGAVGLLPPALVGLAVAALAHPVSARHEPAHRSLRESLLRSLWRHAALLTPLATLGLALLALMLQDARLGASIGVIGFVATVPLARLHRRAQEFSRHALTTGPLRDRAFDLARRAGVALRQVYVVGTGRMRLANAYALPASGEVMVTDRLLEELGRRELDVVLAHEVSHLRPHDLRRRMIAAVGLGSILGVAIASWGTGLATAAIALAGVGGCLYLSRRLEVDADAGAVELTGDAEAQVASLARIERVDGLPLEWGKLARLLATHPSLLHRIYAAAAAGRLSEARVRELVERGCDDPERYPVPATALPGGKLFTSGFKGSAAATLALTLGVAGVLGPLAVLVAGAHAVLPGGRLGLDAACLLVALAAVALARDRLGLLPQRLLAERLRERVLCGLTLGGEVSLVGLSPSAEPRRYEGFGDWDLGFLLVRGERLCYLGEETRFVLRRSQLRAVELRDDAGAWFRTPRVILRWTTGGEAGCVSLRAIPGTSVRAAAARTREVATRIESWRRDGAHNGAGHDDAALPPLGAVTSAPEPAPAAKLASAVVISGALAAVACALAGLPMSPQAGAGLVDLLATSALAQALFALPRPMRRSTKPVAVEAATEERAEEREETRRAA
ncbi:MAG: hypothetical protein A2W00_02375 [Candidatus Eisenbacteria bacterium RBG_16_71_46]|nr:MAG: hypothetical protein A2W00_02375 [Candidatus Eisenbacteria bacterium RBG_16_71_46]